ncbi:GntR family transcriptional regulator [Paenibacillus piri]|uniref:GntR family transcriptional regulator n=1 Tax=Paenibacillus piri TaxID=2547395 RepID=A0A4V2ZSP7_9BACL|nr:GntR family transcriptional regulator [Paenibacillus piri]TDF94094.1 GntR family transcriptional regulator [Paenibacillus piri]
MSNFEIKVCIKKHREYNRICTYKYTLMRLQMDNELKQPKKYKVIKQEIKSWILSGKLKIHEQLATEVEIAEQFYTSRQTARRALGELENEGYLYRVQGRGTFVNNWTVQPQKTTKNIALITSHLFSYIFQNIVQGAEEVLTSRNYGLFLMSTNNDFSKERECLESCLMKPLHGLIIEPALSALPNPNLSYYLSLEEKGIPYVMTNACYPQLGSTALLLDDEKGSFLAVEHLVSLGHKRIAGIFHREVLQGIGRMRGYINALRHFGVPIRNQLVGMYNFLEKSVQPAALLREMMHLPRDERPTALVTYSDQTAVSLLDTIREMGIRIPEDLAIVSFDDSAFATATEIKFTSVAHPKEQMGRMAVELLIDSIEKNIRPTGYVFEPNLVVRQSTVKTIQNE